MGPLHRPEGTQHRYAPLRRLGALERSAEVFRVHRGQSRGRSPRGYVRKLIVKGIAGGFYAANWSNRSLKSHQESAERIAQLRPVDVARLHPDRKSTRL